MFLGTNNLMVLLMFNMVFVIWAVRYNDDDDDDLSTLGARISAQVQRDLAPLQDELSTLGSRINAQVQRNLAPVQDDLSTLGARINAQVQRDIAPLQGLGARINAQVEESLKPVRALELNRKMMDGVGGVTIVTHTPNGRTFIVKNSKMYTCTDKIDIYSGSCSGRLEPFVVTSSSPKTDWCLLHSYSLVNGHVCLGTNGVNVLVTNNVIQCTGSFNSDVFIIKLDEYNNMCSNISEKVEYRYFPDERSNSRVQIPNSNPYVKCENSNNNYCVFYRKNPLLTTRYSGNNVFIVNNS